MKTCESENVSEDCRDRTTLPRCLLRSADWLPVLVLTLQVKVNKAWTKAEVYLQLVPQQTL